MSLLGPLRRIASGGALRARDLAVPMIDQEALLARAETAGPGAGVRRGLTLKIQISRLSQGIEPFLVSRA